MELVCDTQSIDARDRAKVWSETLRSAFGSVNVKPEQRGEPLFGHLKSAQRQSLRFNTLSYRGQRHHRTPADIARLQDEYITLTRPNHGRLDIDYGNRQSVLEPSRIYLFNHAVPYLATPRVEYGTSSIAFPASMLRQRGAKVQALHSLSANDRQGILIATLADQLTAHYAQWSDREFSVLSEQLLDLIALFFFADEGRQHGEESNVRAMHLQHALALIDAQFGDAKLSPARIAQTCGISVSYLYNLFRATGTTVEAAVIAARLDHSKKLLASPQNKHLSIGTIAYMSGFSHPAHFSRSFRERFGCTPRDARVAGDDMPLPQ